MTGAFGKWHLGNDLVGGLYAPNWAGFDHFDGAMRNLSDRETEGFFGWWNVVNGQLSYNTQYATSANVDALLDWTSTQTQPWFAYLAFNAPHSPWQAPPDNLHSEDLPHDLPTHGENARPYYKAMIEAMDHEIGRLIRNLPAHMRDNLTIFFKLVHIYTILLLQKNILVLCEISTNDTRKIL